MLQLLADMMKWFLKAPGMVIEWCFKVFLQRDKSTKALSMVQKELKNLSERQLKIFEVTNNIARGKNK